MNLQIIVLIVLFVIAAIILITRIMFKEEKLIEKAQRNFFFHILAKMTAPTYDGYVINKEEERAINDYLSKQPSEYERHPIGSYFKLSESLKSTLKTCGNFHNYNLNFNISEVGIGVMVMIIFIVVLTLGVSFR